MTTTVRSQERLEILEQIASFDQEQLVFFRHAPSRLRAIVAIDNTVLGPAIGGVRMFPYPNETEAVRDALRLARAMTYKAAMAGLNFGGGKAVIIGDPACDKTEELFRAFGRFIHSLGGRYITSADVGTTVEDLLIVRRETNHVIGLPLEMGGGGDTSVATARGVWKGMKVLAREAFGTDSLAGLRIMVQGAGKVGRNLLAHLLQEGARVYVSDVNGALLSKVSQESSVTVVDPGAVYSAECDIFSPNALGGILNDETVPLLRCCVIAGGANNQLAEPRHGRMLHDRGILYAPDYVINAGGLINICDELQGYCQPRAWHQVERIGDTLARILALSKERCMPTSEVADLIAQEQIKLLGGIQQIYVPSPPSASMR